RATLPPILASGCAVAITIVGGEQPGRRKPGTAFHQRQPRPGPELCRAVSSGRLEGGAQADYDRCCFHSGAADGERLSEVRGPLRFDQRDFSAAISVKRSEERRVGKECK